MDIQAQLKFVSEQFKKIDLSLEDNMQTKLFIAHITLNFIYDRLDKIKPYIKKGLKTGEICFEDYNNFENAIKEYNRLEKEKRELEKKYKHDVADEMGKVVASWDK